MAQDLIDIGINVSAFDAQKQALLSSAIDMFNQLDAYSKKIYTPVLGTGLVQFNNSVAETSKILDELNVKMGAFAANTSTSTSATKIASTATKELTFDQVALRIQLDELNRKRKESTDKIQEQIIKDKLWSDNDKKNKLDAANSQKILTAEIKVYEAELTKQVNLERSATKAQQKKDAADLAKAERDLAREKRETTKASRDHEAQMRREGAVSKTLTDDYKLLRQALQDQQVAYTNLYLNKGKDDPATKAALAQYTQTSQSINQIDKQLVKAGGSADNFGHQLSKVYNILLRAAYIIPGLGVAGLFNLAFEYIGKAVDELGLFDTAVIKAAETEKKLTEILKGQLTIFQNMYAIVKEIHDVDRLSAEGLGKKTLDEAKTAGLAKDVSLPIEIKLLEDKKKLQEADVRFAFGISKGVQTQFEIDQKINETLEKRKTIYSDATKQLTKLNEIEKTITEIKAKPRTTDITPEKLKDIQYLQESTLHSLSDKGEKTRKALREALESTISHEEEKIKLLTKTASNYYEVVDKLDDKRSEKFKFDSDQERKQTIESVRSSIDLNITKNERILNSEVSSLSKRISAIRKITEDERGLLDASFKEIKDNTLTTQKELDTAIIIHKNEVAKIEIKRDIDIAKQIEDNRQRLLTAHLAINSNEINEEAVKNEKIANNEENGYEERLKALGVYIAKRQTLQNIQAVRDIDKLPLKAGDEAAKTDIKRIFSDRDTQKVNIQADIEKQVFNIVESGLRDQLKAVIDANNLQDNESQKAYTLELRRLNDLFEAKKIRYARYAREIKEIQKKFNVSVLDDAIVDDKADIKRLDDQLDNLLKLKDKYDKETEGAFVELDYAKNEKQDTLAAQRAYDTAVGKQKAVNAAIKELELKRQAEKDQLAKDELAREIARIAKENSIRNQWIDAALRIEKALYQAIKEIGDAKYQYRLDQIEKEKQLIDEQYGYELDAIEKSSLYQKDKQALTIQIQAQKMVSDKNAQAEEKRIKIEQAEFDKKLAIANATIGIIAAIIRDGLTTPKAIADAAIGAIEIAKLIATPIPNYEKGTENHPGGKARIGEKGIEVIKEPYKSPWIVYRETVQDLPVGTQVIPIKDTPELGGSVMKFPDTWSQTKWLGKQIRKIQPQKIMNRINIDLGFEMYKHKQLYGK